MVEIHVSDAWSSIGTMRVMYRRSLVARRRCGWYQMHSKLFIFPAAIPDAAKLLGSRAICRVDGAAKVNEALHALHSFTIYQEL